jgi:hypothetical protein
VRSRLQQRSVRSRLRVARPELRHGLQQRHAARCLPAPSQHRRAAGQRLQRHGAWQASACAGQRLGLQRCEELRGGGEGAGTHERPVQQHAGRNLGEGGLGGRWRPCYARRTGGRA